MHLPDGVRINEQGHLEIGGCDTVDLVSKFGTPLYVVDEMAIRRRCQGYHQALRQALPQYQVAYATKAFMNMAICRIMEEEGMALDVVSGGELQTALTSGFPPERIIFHGNNKSHAELRMAIGARVGRIVVDNFDELRTLAQLAAEHEQVVPIFLRITPGVEAHTHSYIQTGQVDSKFGMGIEGGQALQGVREAIASPHLRLQGLHCHIGSQIFELESFQHTVRVMLDFMDQVRSQLGLTLEELDLGGGLGIFYSEGDSPQTLDAFGEAVCTALISHCQHLSYPIPKVWIEPGRSIVGEAGITLYRVGNRKEVPGIRTYLAVDGGMADNPRVALYQAAYRAILANRPLDAPTQTFSIAGKCCESGDMLIWDLPLPDPNPGDILAVFSTGAYNYSMSSNYNRLPRPGVLLARDGKAHWIVKPETYQDLLRNDQIPAHLERSQLKRAAQ